MTFNRLWKVSPGSNPIESLGHFYTYPVDTPTIRPPVVGYAPMEIDALIPALQLHRLGELSAEEALEQAQEQGDSILEMENLD